MTSAKIRIDVDDSQLNAKLREQEVKMKQSFNRMSASGSSLDNMVNKIKGSMGSMIPVASIASVGVIFQRILDTSREFSKEFSIAMREVETISAAVQRNNKEISDEIINMAANGKTGAIELAKAYYQIVSAGHDGAKGLEILSVASKAATAGVTDTKTAADGLTTILNAWSLGAGEATKVADAMFTTVKLGKTTFGELSSQIAQVAPLAAAMKIPFEQILSAVATLTVSGTPTAQAMTQIRSSLINLNKVLPEGWQKMYTYQEALQKVYTMANGSQNELRKLIPDIEGINSVLGLSGEKAETAAGHLNEFTKATGEMTTAYNRMMKEADNQWSEVHNKWMRELKQIGDASLIASTGTAQFFNAMLTGIEDIGNKVPVVNGFFDRIAALKMMGNNSVSAYMKALITPDWSVQDDLGKIINEGNKGIPEKKSKLADILGIEDAQKRLEALQSMLKEVQTEQDDLNKFSYINKESEIAKNLQSSNLTDIINQINEAITTAKKLDTVTTTGVSRLKTVADAEARIKELKEKMGQGTIEQEVMLIAKIQNEQAFIDDFNKKVREKINETITREINGVVSKGVNMTDSYGLNLKMKTPYKDPLQVKKLEVVEQKKLTDEQRKQLEIQKKQEEEQIRIYNLEQQRNKLNEDISKGLEDSAEIIGAISFAVGQLDPQLGQALGKMADLAANAANLFKNLSTGNIVGAVASGIGAIGNIFSLLKGSGEESETTKALMRVNNLLEQQSAILASLSGSNYFQLAEKQYNDYGIAIEANNKKLRESNLLTKGEFEAAKKYYDQQKKDFPNGPIAQIGWQKFISQRKGESANWSPQQFIDAYTSGSAVLNEQQIEWVKGIVDAQKQRAELLQQTFREALGFDAGDVADSIFQGIDDGLKLGKDSLGDFSQSFGELMKKALMQSIIDGMNIKLTEGFLTDYKNYMSDGILSPEERKALEDTYRGIVQQAQIDAENIKSITDPYLNSENKQPQQQGLTGAIKGITEETAGLIAGQFSAMRVDLKAIEMNTKLIQNQFEMMDQSLGVLQNIERNTQHNKRLNDVVDRLDKTNKLLEERL